MNLTHPIRIQILNLAPDWPALTAAVQAMPLAVAVAGFDPHSAQTWPHLVVLSLDQPLVWDCSSLEELFHRFPLLTDKLVTCQAADNPAARAKTLALGGVAHWQFCQDPGRMAERLQAALEISRLRAEQGFLREALSKIGVCAAELDSNLRYQAVNSAYASVVAREPQLILGHRADEVVPAALVERVLPRLTQALSGQEVRFQAELAGVFKEAYFAPKPAGGLLVLLKDTSELQREQERLKAFREMVDSSLDGIALVRKSDAAFVDFNQQACRLFGYSPAEMRKMTVLDIDAKLNGYEQWKAIADHTHAKGHALIETQGKSKSGQTFPAEVASHYIEYAGQGHFVVVIRDITERQEMEIETRAKRAELSSILRAFGDLYLWLDMQGRIQGYQVTLFRAYGLPYENMIGNLVDQVFSPEVAIRIHTGIDEILQGQPLAPLGFTLHSEKGTTTFDARLVPVRDNQILLLARKQ